jgi:methyltransferase
MAFVTFQRLAELWLAKMNTRALLAKGAVEYSPKHYGLIVALHTSWLASLWYVAIFQPQPLNIFWMAVFFIFQLGRVWVLLTLKDRWTTRIIILPGAPLVRSGPYKFVSHPNYIVVIGEIAALPLAFGLPLYAILFSVLNGAILYYRIGQENRALSQVIL